MHSIVHRAAAVSSDPFVSTVLAAAEVQTKNSKSVPSILLGGGHVSGNLIGFCAVLGSFFFAGGTHIVPIVATRWQGNKGSDVICPSHTFGVRIAAARATCFQSSVNCSLQLQMLAGFWACRSIPRMARGQSKVVHGLGKGFKGLLGR